MGDLAFSEASGWWTERRPGLGVSRNDLFAQWFAQTYEPKANANTFIGELQGWGSLVGRRPWAKDRYGATAAERLHRLASAELDDIHTWDQVSRYLREHGDRLARIVCDVVMAVRGEVPGGLSETARTAIRGNLQTSIGTRLRAKIVASNSQFAEILETHESLIGFASPGEILLEWGRRSLLRAVLDVGQKQLDNPRRTWDDSDWELIDDWFNELQTVWGEADPDIRQPTADELAAITALLDAEVRALQAGPHWARNADRLPEAYELAMLTLRWRVVRGKPLIPILGLKLAKLYQRDRSQGESRHVSLDDLAETDDGSRYSTTEPGEFSHLLAQAERAISLDLADFPQDCFEKVVVFAILRGGDLFFGGLDHGNALADWVAFRWDEAAAQSDASRPATSVSQTVTEAVDNVRRLLAMALSEVYGKADYFAIGSWTRRGAAARLKRANDLLERFQRELDDQITNTSRTRR